MTMRGHVRKRGDRWAYVIELGRDPLTGKRRQKWASGFREEEDAQRDLTRALYVLDNGGDPFPPEITVARFVNDHWIPHLQTQGRLRESTMRGYRQLMRQHVVPRIGAMPIVKVKPAHAQSVLDEMTRSGLAPRTVGHARAAMSACWQWALKGQVVTLNVVRATDAPHKAKPKLRTPTPSDLRAIMDAARDTPWEIPVMIAATTGARRGEVLGLRWGKVDLELGRAYIVVAVQRIDGELCYVEPKTERGTRMVPLYDEVVGRLRQHRREQAERLLALGIRVTDDHPVCDRGDGTPHDPSTFTHAAKRITAAAGVTGVRLHDLRHAVGTQAAKLGRPDLTSLLLGHASTSFTMDRYVHPSPDELDAVGAALARALEQA